MRRRAVPAREAAALALVLVRPHRRSAGRTWSSASGCGGCSRRTSSSAAARTSRRSSTSSSRSATTWRSATTSSSTATCCSTTAAASCSATASRSATTRTSTATRTASSTRRTSPNALTVLEDGVRITYHATVLAGVHVGEQAMVGAMARGDEGRAAVPRVRRHPGEERAREAERASRKRTTPYAQTGEVVRAPQRVVSPHAQHVLDGSRVAAPNRIAMSPRSPARVATRSAAPRPRRQPLRARVLGAEAKWRVGHEGGEDDRELHGVPRCR